MVKINDPLELIKKIASDSVIDSAYDWLCERRRTIHTMTRSGTFFSDGLSSSRIYHPFEGAYAT